MSEDTAFIGLGVMGYPMAGFLAKAGHNVTVYNRTTSKAEKWVKEYGGNLAMTPAEAAKNAAYNFIMAYKSGDSGMAGSDTSLEALEDLYRDAVRVGQEQNINLETQDAEEKLEDINKQIQEEYDKQKELGFRYEL